MSYKVYKKIRKKGKVVAIEVEEREGVLYSVSDEDINNIDKKIQKNKDFVDRHNLPSFDFVLNPKKSYFELQNRVKTFVEKCQSIGLSPIFLTITLPSEFHDIEKYDINYLVNLLSQFFADFKKTRFFRKSLGLSSANFKYFRVIEPHKSGVPHYHILAFVPSDVIVSLKKYFYHYFCNVVGVYSRSLDFKYKFHSKKGNFSGVINYVLKYMQKFRYSIDDILSICVDSSTGIIDEKKYNKYYNSFRVLYWYKKYSIRRFSFSRVLVPITIYRKLYKFYNFRLDSLRRLDELYSSGRIHITYATIYEFDDSGSLIKKRKIIDSIFLDYFQSSICLYNRKFSSFVYYASLVSERIKNRYMEFVENLRTFIYKNELLDLESDLVF